MITTREAYTRDDYDWIKATFTVTVGADFASYAAIVAYASEDEAFGGGTPAVDPAVREMLADGQILPVFFSRRKCRDTSLGGNDAINCFPQFCENDDIMHPFTTVRDNDPRGLGRVYSEMHDDQQQIMYLSFGVPVFSNLAAFYKDAVISDLADLMNTGATQAKIGELLGNALSTFITLPALPLMYINRILGGLTRARVTKYYDFADKMPLYYRCVNSILVHLAVNLGLANDAAATGGRPYEGGVTGNNTTTNATALQTLAQVQGEGGDGAGLPDVFREAGFDILRIMLRKHAMEEGTSVSQFGSTDQALLASVHRPPATVAEGDRTWTEDLISSFAGALDDFSTGLSGGLYGAHRFVGFRIERSTDSTESLSNQVGPSEIAQTLNSKAQGARQISFGAMNGNFGGGFVEQLAQSAMGALGDLMTGVAQGFGVDGLKSVLTGSALVDIPDVWQNSAFSRSYNFNINLRATYADPVSIMQDLYVPTACLLGGALPRAAGTNSYTQPFLCRAYCKGMFAVPMGIIDSMTIRRGGDTHGWNTHRLPMAIDISFTIRDLSPAMFLAVGDSSIWQEVFGQTSSFQEYLLTLSGMGLMDRLSYYADLKRRAQRLLNIVYNRHNNPTYWGLALADTPPGRVLSQLIPTTRIPTN